MVELFKYSCGAWNEMSIGIINGDVAMASVQENNEYTEHHKSNVYISIFVTAYATNCTKNEQRRVLYFNTDSVIYESPDGYVIHPGTSATMEFVSAGPKTYGL